MIICDAKYMAELKRLERMERKDLSRADWIGIDTELGLLWGCPDSVLFTTRTVALAFNVNANVIKNRTARSSPRNYQGDMPKQGPYKIGTWFDWATVNKSTIQFQTWSDPNDLIQAFQFAHRIIRYREHKRKGIKPQTRLDQRSLENDHQSLPV